MLVRGRWILQKLNSDMKIKFGKFFWNSQKEDKEIKIMREMMSDIEDRRKKSSMHVSRILERERAKKLKEKKIS